MKFTPILASGDDSAFLIIGGIFVLSMFWIFYLKDKFWRAILGPPTHEVLANQAKTLMETEINKFQTRVDHLHSELATKEERMRKGESPLSTETIEKRRGSLNAVSQKITDSKSSLDSQSYTKHAQDILAAYLAAAIDIKSDTVQELEFSLTAAEAARTRTGNTATAESISELRGHIEAARKALQTAREGKDSSAVARSFDSAVDSVQAGETVANALRLAGLK